MKCDLHVHSRHSGHCNIPFFKSFCRESYNDPEAVYQALKRKGMHLVTLTDHDSIDGAERLRRYPDFFVSEEVTCRMPSGTSAHVGVYNLTERQHIEIQRRRNDLPSLLAYLSECRLFFSINHVFSALTGERHLDDFDWFEEYFPGIEVLNGQMPPFHNRQAWQLAARQEKAGVGGSDAHVMASVGTAYTEVAGARDPDDFFRGLRAGRGTVGGDDGGYFRLTRAIFSIAAEMICEKPLTAGLVPLAPVIPVAMLAVALGEAGFARRWSRSLRTDAASRVRARQFPAANQFAERFA